MKHSFNMIPKAELPRSSFDLSHSLKTTFDEGKLIPVYVEEVLPGDSFNLTAHTFCRLAAPLSVPILDNLKISLQFFFVPNRLVWENWQRFNGEQKNPGDSTDFLVPTINSGASGFAVESIFDYMGIPIGVPNLEVNALPFRAYNLIYNEWYRDQNLIDSVPVVDSDSDLASNYQILRRAKMHDYFTSALPWPQKGPGVELPLGTSAPVIGNGMTLGLTDGTQTSGLVLPAAFNTTPGALVSAYGKPVGSSGNSGNPSNLSKGVTTDPEKSGLIADLSSATAATINSLRLAFQMQKYYEAQARGGSRYTEILRSFFGVVSPDARLQRPEYLGGIEQPIIINAVAQTSSSDNTTPQANLSAYGVVGFSKEGFSKSFVEHGYIIGIASVRADLTYQQGLRRMWSRQTRFDFYWPTFAHLGEQAILNKEIFAQGSAVKDDNGNVVDDEPFGYQERWAEYRHRAAEITGKMRSTASQPLDVWHLAQKFNNLPVLNQEFIEENAPMERVSAVPTEPDFLMDVYFKVKCARVMPTYSVPGLIDHF